jgi:hypothetical protein
MHLNESVANDQHNTKGSMAPTKNDKQDGLNQTTSMFSNGSPVNIDVNTNSVSKKSVKIAPRVSKKKGSNDLNLLRSMSFDHLKQQIKRRSSKLSPSMGTSRAKLHMRVKEHHKQSMKQQHQEIKDNIFNLKNKSVLHNVLNIIDICNDQFIDETLVNSISNIKSR